MTDSGPDHRAIAERLKDLPLIERALSRAVREALLQHKRAGNPVSVWRDGRVCWIAPEEIQVADSD